MTGWWNQRANNRNQIRHRGVLQSNDLRYLLIIILLSWREQCGGRFLFNYVRWHHFYYTARTDCSKVMNL